jgi:hypothetical protein
MSEVNSTLPENPTEPTATVNVTAGNATLPKPIESEPVPEPPIGNVTEPIENVTQPIVNVTEPMENVTSNNLTDTNTTVGPVQP